MAVPSPGPLVQPWTDLTPQEKRARLLDAAAEVLSRDGIDAPMPAIAAAAGIGIGSVYRQFVSRDDLVAALVIERIVFTTEEARAALDASSAWDALVALMRTMVERQIADDLMSEAIARTSDRPDVSERLDACSAAIEQLLVKARAEGTLRADATIEDVYLVFAGARAGEQRLPGGARRMLELLVDALRARPA
ncbi:MAG: regulatory protein TetR [Conexibacter sp.]|jgi:AcrR family transcriptional regulator|nr:regulatory protein TetR [Conexibacter sp.]